MFQLLLTAGVALMGALLMRRRAVAIGTESATGAPKSLSAGIPSVEEVPVTRSVDGEVTAKGVQRVVTDGTSVVAGAASGGAAGAAAAAATVIVAGAQDLMRSLLGGGAAGEYGAQMVLGIPTLANGGTTLSYTGGAAAAVTAGGLGGMVGGQAIDRLLGGTGSELRGFVAMTLGGAIGCALLACGYVVAAVVAIVAAIIYAAVVWIGDAVRYKWAQDGGAIKDFAKKRDDTAAMLRQRLALADPNASYNQVERCARGIADGFMLQTNRMAYDAAMALSWGIGATRASHAKWQLDHGSFIGGVTATGDLDETWLRQNLLIGRDQSFVGSAVPSAERSVIPNRNEWRASAVPGSGFGLNVKLEYLEKNNFCDMAEPVLHEVGEHIANAAAYASHMQSTWGVGQSETSHGAWGRNAGKFQGTFLKKDFRFVAAGGTNGVATVCEGTGGLLQFRNRLMYWRDVKNLVGPFVQVEVPAESKPLSPYPVLLEQRARAKALGL